VNVAESLYWSDESEAWQMNRRRSATWTEKIVSKPVTTKTSGLTLESLRERREQILRIAAEHGAHSVRVFGSVARGQTRSDSDIDFLVELEPTRTVLDLSSLILDLEDALGYPVDVVEIRHLSTIAEKILREAVPL
jgi:predicted nucleotidyltransferase